MKESTKKLLVDLVFGLLIAIAAAFLFDLFHAPTAMDAYRILSDCFFLAAVIQLGSAGLTWTKNGGVWDGIGFTFKTAILRIRKQYDEDRMTFAQYREERESKIKSSPVSALIAGAVYLVIALVFLALYNMAL